MATEPDVSIAAIVTLLRDKVASRAPGDRISASQGARGLFVGSIETLLKNDGLSATAATKHRYAFTSLVFGIPGGRSKSKLLTQGMCLGTAEFINDDGESSQAVVDMAKAAMKAAKAGADPAAQYGPLLYNDPLPPDNGYASAPSEAQGTLDELEYVPVEQEDAQGTTRSAPAKATRAKSEDHFASFYDKMTPDEREALKATILERTGAIPEAAAAANFSVMGPGGVTQVTIRDVDELSLMERLIPLQNRLRKFGWKPCNKFGDLLDKNGRRNGRR